MTKWYELAGNDRDVVAASRVRLVRGLKDHCFPWKLSAEEAGKLTAEMTEKLKGLGSIDGKRYENSRLSAMTALQRSALRERQLIGKAAAEEPKAAGLILSADEAVSIVLNSEDHVRIQVSRSGSDLREAWTEADRIDDYVNEHYAYAYDEQFGYLTAYPTNLGTGLKAFQVLHLPLLDSVSRFQELTEEIGRYGVKLKPAFSTDRQLNGNMHVLYNEKTLGSSEEEILQLLEKVSDELIDQERELREASVEEHRLEVEDICRKAYGTLHYARLMTMKMAMNMLSQLRWGQEMGVVAFETHCDFYELMLQIQEANLKMAGKSIAGDGAGNEQRALWVKDHMPPLKE